MDLSQKLSEHFSLWECIRSETAARFNIDNSPPEKYIPKLEALCRNILEPIRVFYNIPFRPNSVYRCPLLNKLIGGASDSQHMKAEAADIEIPGISNYHLAIAISQYIEIEIFDQLILECHKPLEPNSGWVHISYRIEVEDNRRQILTYQNGQYLQGIIL